ncbi:tetraacyldisaccharide 4'-kinase [Lacipirellula limnantheis]|uniref:Tetraacyldisaccharide 4'-kinase n=1 Tax=Lacipirellula limnantheis TaxID=2528024 RepID=A0A517U4B1_9BACT|nr:tetraacyldisaccharide 4'-kinase [Lacipirellula limnantheis]QDT75435.1 Tetraacyldisaccharide 4'-kinase [Lacipirellula limnantheis]
MISPSTFRDLVSGRRRGVGAALARLAMGAASVPYGWAIRWRNGAYDRGTKEVQRPSVPVISVGNLTVGGTGKTPMVEWLARQLRQRDIRVAILSRGYGAEQGSLNDEALELELSLPDVPHLQNPDRAAAAQIAVDELATQLLLLDDGFQHRRLARDFDLVLLDATEPFGFDRLLPRGTLREPVTGLRRAKAVVLSRADMIDAAARQQVRTRVERLAPQAVWAEVEHRPAALVDSAGASYGLEELRGQSILAFCGIGNPAGFRHTLEGLGCQIAAWREFPDHHNYTREDVEELAQLVRTSGSRVAVCTRKDLVKLRVPTVGGAPLRAVSVELRFLRGEAELTAAMEPIVDKAGGANEAMFSE